MMTELQISSTRFTPLVKIDSNKKIVEVRGRSVGQETECIYNPLVAWIDKNPGLATNLEELNFYLDYTSARTVRCIFSILLLLKSHSAQNLIVNWYYNELDDTVKETIEDLSHLVPYPVNVIPEEF